MKYTYFITLLILASATLGSAQLPFGNEKISPNCQNTLLGLVGNTSVNSCFPFQSVLGLVTSGTSPNQTALASAADAICADPKCSNDLVNQTQATVQSGCQADLANNILIVNLVNFILTFYSPTRDSVCFKNSTGGYCFIETDSAVQQILSSAPANQSPLLTFLNAPQTTICTPCNKAISNSYVNYIGQNPNVFTEQTVISNQNYTSAKAAISGKCGSSFLDGQVGNSSQNPSTFQSQPSSNNNKSDAMSLIANYYMSLLVVLIGSSLAIL